MFPEAFFGFCTADSNSWIPVLLSQLGSYSLFTAGSCAAERLKTVRNIGTLRIVGGKAALSQQKIRAALTYSLGLGQS